MQEIVIIAEGQTEEQFIKSVLAPSLRCLHIYAKPVLMNTSKTAKGGAINYARLENNARNILRQNSDVFLTTFIDLYKLDTDFPEYENAKRKNNVMSRVVYLEKALHLSIISRIGCRSNRFLPYIQPYEFEGLLFSNVEALCNVEPGWQPSIQTLQNIRNNADSPEHINEGYETKPSRRLEKALNPTYKKTRHGPLASQKIGLEIIERECEHFRNWMISIRNLAQSA